jgi:hypothetical protein
VAGPDDQVHCPPGSSITFSQELIDNAMAIPIVTSSEDFLPGGTYYGRLANCMTFLAIVAHDDPTATSSSGFLVRDRVVAHVRVTATAAGTPRLRGGHASWYDYSVPLAWAIVRRSPPMWSQLTNAERAHLDLVMEHVLHVGAIFCQPNSLDSSMRATVQVDMGGNNAGSVPNQSASFHAFLLAAFIYFGGVDAMDDILAAYDVTTFKSRLLDAGLTTIHGFYADTRIAKLLNGVDQTETLGPGWRVDPLGVRKTIAELNTSSLIDSLVGEEHPYHPYDPVLTTPNNILWRWGHEFFAGCQPRSNVGPDVDGACDGTVFGLVDDEGELRAVIPYEFDGVGMPYEFNARGSVGGPHTRSSWDYAKWGFTFYTYMYSVTAMLGYYDLDASVQDQAQYDQLRKTAEIMRFIGEHKWRSSEGPRSHICTWNHPDGYDEFAGNHWGQGMLDSIVFSGAPLPKRSRCPADITGPVPGVPDGRVDALDFLLVISQWGTAGPNADIAGEIPCVPDGIVDALDYLAVIAQWGTPANCAAP